jgi:hypothetical protein
MAPREYWSAAGPACRVSPRACSGAMYWGVPTIDPDRVWPSSSSSFLASPKSAILSAPSAPTRTFWGFRSRWTTLWSWAYWMARARAWVMAAASSGGCGSFRVFLWSGPPSTYSMAKYGSPSWSPSSYTWTIPGWVSRADASASVWNRASCSAPACPPARIIFRATTRFSLTCRAL